MKQTYNTISILMNKLCRVCILYLFLGVFVGSVVFSAESSGRTVRVGYGALPGYHDQFPDGRRSGYGYEYLRRIADRAGWKCEYVGYDKSWSELLLMLERAEIDLLSCVNKTPERERKFAFSENPLGTSFVNLTVKAGNTRYHQGNYAAWSGIRVGMVRGNQLNEAFKTWAKSQNIQYTQVLFASDVEAGKALQQDKIDALVSINFRSMHNEWLLIRIEPEAVFFAVGKNNPKLLSELD
ncbi:MAG: transporter substrate-binding domain-containing protein [Thermoguttaceae bacterium]|nr:transporter substrate-binding domain-containing protein [Thermoguttaceae bacterium]